MERSSGCSICSGVERMLNHCGNPLSRWKSQRAHVGAVLRQYWWPRIEMWLVDELAELLAIDHKNTRLQYEFQPQVELAIDNFFERYYDDIDIQGQIEIVWELTPR